MRIPPVSGAWNAPYGFRVALSWGAIRFAFGTILRQTEASLIVEVLSPSTERIDLNEKFDNYITIPSLLEFVAVSQDTPFLRLFRRRNNWRPEACYAEDTVRLESVGLDIEVRQIYRRVKREVGLLGLEE